MTSLFILAFHSYVTEISVHGPNLSPLVLDLLFFNVAIPESVTRLHDFSLNFPSFDFHTIYYYPVYVTGADIATMAILFLCHIIPSRREQENEVNHTHISRRWLH